MNPFKDLFFHDAEASHDNDHLIIPRQSINKVLALTMLLLFGIFMTGYFLGKRKAAELFNRSLEQEMASDKINVSLTNVYDAFQKSSDERIPSAMPSLESFEEIDAAVPQGDGVMPAVRYQAQLLGGTSAMVQKFVDRLAQKGITIIARKRSSKTAQGKIVSWHQALTPVMADRASLEELVERIKKLEKLDGIRIVEIKG